MQALSRLDAELVILIVKNNIEQCLCASLGREATIAVTWMLMPWVGLLPITTGTACHRVCDYP